MAASKLVAISNYQHSSLSHPGHFPIQISCALSRIFLGTRALCPFYDEKSQFSVISSFILATLDSTFWKRSCLRQVEESALYFSPWKYIVFPRSIEIQCPPCFASCTAISDGQFPRTAIGEAIKMRLSKDREYVGNNDEIRDSCSSTSFASLLI
jgi:hypothetical protein